MLRKLLWNFLKKKFKRLQGNNFMSPSQILCWRNLDAHQHLFRIVIQMIYDNIEIDINFNWDMTVLPGGR